jgi:hypothetical protein
MRSLFRRRKFSLLKLWKVARVQAVGALSQLTAAGQLAALLLVVGHSRITDTYTILYSASQLSVSALLIGSLQPVVLSSPGYSAWRRWIFAGIIANIALLSGTSSFLILSHYPSGEVLTTAGVLALYGCFIIVAYVLAIHDAAMGNPLPLAGATGVSNVVAVAVLLLRPSHIVPMMCAGMLVGAMATCLLFRRIGLRRRAVLPIPEAIHDTFNKSDLAWLVFQSGVGGLGVFLLQAVTARYPPGQATVLGVILRVASGVVTIGVTGFLTATTDWRQRSTRPLRVAIRISLIALSVCVPAMYVGAGLAADSAWNSVIAAAAFVFAAAAESCGGRVLPLVGRLRVFRTMGLLSAPLYGLETAALAFTPHIAAIYLIVVTLSCMFPTVALLRAIKWRTEALWLGLLVIGTCGAMVILCLRG